MKITRSATAATVFAAVLLAGACSSSKSSSASSAPTTQTTTSAASASSSASTSASGSASTAAPSTAGQSTAAPSTAGSSAGSDPSGSACQSSNLKVTVIHGTDADPDPSKSDTAAIVSMTNTGQSTCTVQGHPQVDLISATGVDWPLEPQAGDTPKLTLKPGVSALGSVHLLSHTAGGGGSAFQVKSAKITPPDTKTATTVPWPWTWALEDQSAATHAGTFAGAMDQTGT